MTYGAAEMMSAPAQYSYAPQAAAPVAYETFAAPAATYGAATYAAPQATLDFAQAAASQYNFALPAEYVQPQPQFAVPQTSSFVAAPQVLPTAASMVTYPGASAMDGPFKFYASPQQQGNTYPGGP